MKRLTISSCHDLAARKNGKCLSSEYITSKNKYLWECAKGHQWTASHNSVQRGQWCPECVGLKPRSIDDCHGLAESMGGKFLSSEYVNCMTHYAWQCSKGHKWKASYNRIEQGTWCPECASLSLEDYKKLAYKRGGFFISSQVHSSTECYVWECSKGHQWKALFFNIKRGSWCPRCVTGLKAQNELAEFCKTINSNFIENAKPFSNSRLELDIYYPELKRAIELDGNYWHSKQKSIERDSRKNKLCEEYGIELLRISYDKCWSSQFSKASCKKTIEKFINTIAIISKQ